MHPARSLWVEDQYAHRCRSCEARFNITRRRHHCRNCGQVFCSDCLITPSTTIVRKVLVDVISSLLGLQRETNMKVCHKCNGILRQRNPAQKKRHIISSSNLTTSTSLVTNTRNSMKCLETRKSSNETASQRCDVSKEMVFSDSNLQDEQEVIPFDETMIPSVISQPSMERLPTHAESEKEQEISYALTDTPLYSLNSISVWLSKLMKDGKNGKSCEKLQTSKEVKQKCNYIPYPKAIFRRVTDSSALLSLGNMFPAHASVEFLQCFERLSSLHLIKRASKLFMKENLLSSFTNSSTIDKDIWIGGICDISWQIVSGTKVALYKHITEHFDVVCIPGDSFVNTEIISGIAFIQTVVSKRMKIFIEEPRILLLAGDVGITLNRSVDILEYTEGYRGYLDKQYHRIQVWKPSVIVVEGNMHHYLQEKIIRDSSATLILHAGETTINRLSRCCNATIVRDLQYVSADDLCNSSFLGSCHIFQVIHIDGKPVSIFKGLPAFLFITVLLRGGKLEELEVVKQILFKCTISAYHLALQAHCLFDFGIKCEEIHNEKNIKKVNVENSSPSAFGKEVSSLHYGECEEYMKLVKFSPRFEDRVETLSMNVGVIFPEEVINIDEKYDDLIVDSIIVNNVFLNCVTDALNEGGGGDGVEDITSGVVSNSISPNFTVRQSREVFPFYSEGDETLLEYLNGRVREGDSTRLILHSNKRIWVKVTTDFNNSQVRRMTEEGNLSSIRSMSYRSSLDSGDFVEDVIQKRHLRCYAVCKNCINSEGNLRFSSLATNCSMHTLNISWGAFLELLIYGDSSLFTLSCGHSLSESISLSFIFFTHSVAEVTVNIIVEPLAVYDIITPNTTMPLCEDVAKLYLSSEIEELQQSIMRIITSIHSVMVFLSGKQSQTLPYSGNTKQLNPSQINVRNPIIDFSLCNDVEKGRVLLQRSEELLEKLTTIETFEGVILVRLEFLPNLVRDFLEWYNAKMLATERRVSKAIPNTIEIGKIEDPYWAYNPSDNCVIRLNEPSSIVALAVQAMSLSTTNNNTGLNRDVVDNNDNSQQPPSTTCSRETVVAEEQEEEGERTLVVDETQQSLFEGSIEVMLGVDSIVLSDFLSSTSFLGTTFDAIKILRGRNILIKPTFKHVMTAMIPGDKNEEVNVIVEVMFPEQFAALQYLYTKGRSSELVFSLSRCRPLKTEGGKSKSEFFISLDGRFLMKQVKSAEVKHFAEFGPNYFSHLSQIYDKEEENNSFFEDIKPFGGVLAKIFGLFSLHIKRKKRFSETPSEIRYFVLMENIFYSRQINVTYDLKGSQRNRNAAEGSSVLLDQNLVNKLRIGEFFYCRNEVKSLIMERLTSEAHMLSTCSIMDYSLLVGLNTEKQKLYLGIVDYLHPYSGAKVIESKVKAGIDTVLGHAGRDPTIIDPVSYRVRFARWVGDCLCGVPEKTLPLRRAWARKKQKFNGNKTRKN
ncbi:Phosphatidylinositol-4-phosphate 5-kinase [Trypanosoma melophagium]|uniref:Phosphatidylinositol-4-phosphate 5-kinase n=1 Tax=Trypanosoma melophagium TaxID=715481 RepID=UPI00351AAAAF|nr:Phosphatidylinositol-4-phosphate 5-kinase [Trypanosoma melophagium]